MSRQREGERGQAVVELALGMLVFITILAFGIHFAEVSYMSIRVQQAAAFALYDATAQRAHEQGNVSKFGTIAGLATQEARKRWKDFEANTGAAGASAKMSHVFTEIDGMFIQCTNEDSIKYSTSVLTNPLTPNPYSALDRGGIKCTARAQISVAPGFPKDFFDNEWNLKSKHYAGDKLQYTVCATPRATNGTCGFFGLLVGDYSLQGREESASQDLFKDKNDAGDKSYRKVADEATGLITCAASMALSGTIAWTASPEACSFQFSYKGVEKNYTQDLGDVHTGAKRWNTAGTNSRRTGNIQQVALGVNRNW